MKLKILIPTAFLGTGAFVALIIYLSQTSWYGAYSAPMMTVKHGRGSVEVVPFGTIDALEVALKNAVDNIYMRATALPVQANLGYYRSLLRDNFLARGWRIDCLVQMGRTQFGSRKSLQDAATSQEGINAVLAANNYRAVGLPGTWHGHRPAHAIDTEEPELYNLYARTKELLDGDPNRSLYREIDRLLVWLRAEVAVAKLVAYMRQHGVREGALIFSPTQVPVFRTLSKLGLIDPGFVDTVPGGYNEEWP